MLAGYPGYLHKVRAALLAISILVVTMAGLAVAATPGVAEFRHQREHDLTPAETTARHAKFNFMVTGGDRLWAGHRVTRVFLSLRGGDSEQDTPPGVTAFPAAGEAFVSPHLRELMRKDPLVRALVGSARVVGTIGPGGLADPDENRALIGLPSTADARLTPASSWGAPPMVMPSEARVMIVLGIFLAILVIVPAIALAAITARLGETERGDRAAILRMLGAPQSVAAQISAAEVALVGVPTSAAAVALFTWLAARGIHVPVVDLTVFPEAAHVPWLAQLVVALFAVGVHGAIAALVSARGRTVNPLLATQPLRLRSLLLLAAGVLLLAGLALVTALPPAIAGVAFFIGAAAVAMSLATAMPTAIRWLAGRAAGQARRAGTLYGLRLLAERSLPSTRIAALIALLIVALGTAVPFLAILNGGGAPGLAEYVARHPRTIVSVFDSGLDARRTTQMLPHHAAAPMFTAEGDTGEGVTVLAATCDEAAALLETTLDGCTDAPIWLSDETALAPSRVSALKRASGDLPVPPTSRVLHVRNLPGELGGLLLISPAVAGNLRTDPSSAGIAASIPTRAVDRYLATVSAMAPWAQTRTDSLEASNPDQKLYPGTSRLVILAAWTSILLATLALVAASLGEVAAQRRRSGHLDVLGARAIDFARLHFTTTAVPLLLAGGVATVVSVLIGRALLHMDDRAGFSLTMYLTMTVGTIVVSGLTTAVTAPLVRTAPR